MVQAKLTTPGEVLCALPHKRPSRYDWSYTTTPPTQHLLEHKAMPPTLHPTILRATKHIHLEALAVLYRLNKFRAKIEYCNVEHPFRSIMVSSAVGCSPTITGPGGEPTFHQEMPRTLGYASWLRRLLRDQTMGMLRALTHFTIDLDLVTPGKSESNDYVNHAHNAMSSLCLAFIGRSNSKELTIKVNTGDSEVTNTNLALFLWPLLFLPTGVVVKIQGASALPVAEPAELAGLYMGPTEERGFGRQIADVRRICSAEIESRRWKNRYRTSEWALNQFHSP
jgi:hypothetical protein